MVMGDEYFVRRKVQRHARAAWRISRLRNDSELEHAALDLLDLSEQACMEELEAKAHRVRRLRHEPRNVNHKGLVAMLEEHERANDYHKSRPGQIIVPSSMDFEARQEGCVKLTNEYGGHADAYKNIPFVSLEVDVRDEQRVMESISKASGFHAMSIHRSTLVRHPEIILPDNREARVQANPKALWNLVNIGALAAREYSDGRGKTACIIDTGIDYEHPELSGCFGPDKGWNYIDRNDEIMDKDIHGTHVAGIIAGMNTGVAPGIMLKAAVVLDGNGMGTAANVMHALDDAISEGVDVVNFSLGSNHYVRAFEQLCMAAYKKGLMIAAAAGNESSTMYSYPAAYQGVLGVAAVDRMNEHAGFSNTNDSNDISAPGVRILSTIPGGYQELSGTSMATPHVTASLAMAAAYMSKCAGCRSAHKDAEAVYELMLANTQGIGNDKERFGHGLVRPDLVCKNYKSPGKIPNGYAQGQFRYNEGIFNGGRLCIDV